MKILLVDDDKTGRTTTVTDISSVYGFEVTSCSDTYTAKKHLSKNEFCLVIIDLYLPEYTNSEVSTDAGIKLIQYIFETNDNIIRPQGILVLSKNLKEIEYYNQLLYYPVAVIDTTPQNDWESALHNRISYYANLHNNIDIAIITAIDVEFNAIYDDNWREDKSYGAITFYRKCFKNKYEQNVKAILFKAENKGMVSSSVAISTLLKFYNPRYLFMIGITGGNPKKVKSGDIIVANKAYDYSFGAIIEGENDTFEFEPDYLSESADDDLINVFSSYKLNKNLLFNIRQKASIGTSFNQDIKLHIGSIATGQSVIKSEEFVKRFIKNHNRGYCGIDMETYAVYYTCRKLNRNVKFLSIKSVSDYADTNKSDEFQGYCAKLSTELLLHFISENLNVDN